VKIIHYINKICILIQEQFSTAVNLEKPVEKFFMKIIKNVLRIDFSPVYTNFRIDIIYFSKKDKKLLTVS
jgi:hypothetical protein